jgi:tetratricopeptide (TPR) repeat protein
MSVTPIAPAEKKLPDEGTRIFRKPVWGVALVLMVPLAIFAWVRTGMLDLPAVPANLTLEASGLSGLGQMKQLNDEIWSAPQTGQPPPKPPALTGAAALVQRGIAAYRRGEIKEALELMRQGIRLEPDNLVLANAYRMVVFGLRRDFLAAARRESKFMPKFPAELDRQPIVFFEELDRQHSTRETKLHLALAWVDEMLLFPALEMKAPSSVQSVDLLTQVIENDNPGYVPALFARGLNHLHRPSRLVWPESTKSPRDAAVQDIGKCVAIGRRFNVGSARLKATLALSLGDSYVKAGRLGVAHSWWQIAQNLCHDDDLQAAIRRRYSWQNEEILDRLEEELDRSRSELDHPMTDLAIMWN